VDWIEMDLMRWDRRLGGMIVVVARFAIGTVVELAIGVSDVG